MPLAYFCYQLLKCITGISCVFNVLLSMLACYTDFNNYFQMLLATRSPEVSGDHMIQQGEESLHDIITLEDSECHYGVRVARYTPPSNKSTTYSYFLFLIRSETNCPVCSLSLTANLPSSVGLCTFVCGE